MAETTPTGTTTVTYTYTYDITNTDSITGSKLSVDLSCLNFLNDGSECLETLKSMKKEMETIRDNTSAFYFESDNGTEPGANYQEACQKIIDFIDDLIGYIESAYTNLTTGITNINNELEGCFTWTGYNCVETPHASTE